MSVDSQAGPHHHDARAAAEIRLLIVDDHAGVRAGLADVLSAEPDITVVGECEDGVHVAAAFDRLAPDVVLMDHSMPEMDGLTATSLLLEAHPEARVVMLTALGAELRPAAVAAGARGFLTKSGSSEALVRCIRSVVVGCSCCLEPLSA
jgi:DNA-binding NarL/FixJ family response regulator